jgi:hypothetical protein
MQCPQNMMLETIPKVDAKPEAKKNNTTIDIAGKVGFDLNDSFKLGIKPSNKLPPS